MYDGNELISSTLVEQEAESENILRPQTLEGYIGQDKVKENLMVYISAARRRNENLDHVLLYGPPGLGKTTLAHIIANEMHTRITVTSGPAIEKAADLVALLSKLTENEVLFIDEIHRLNHSVEEILYPALEDYALDFIIGKGPSAKSIRLSLPRFTLVGATTKAGRLSAPLRDRFGVHARLEMYSTEQLVKIVRNSSKVLETEIDAEAAAMLAGRSRGTPRIANRLLKRVRDFAQVKGEGRITPEITDFALSCMGIDELGLDGVDRNIILSMIDKFNGGPVGLETVAAASGEAAARNNRGNERYERQKDKRRQENKRHLDIQRAAGNLVRNTERSVHRKIRLIDLHAAHKDDADQHADQKACSDKRNIPEYVRCEHVPRALHINAARGQKPHISFGQF